MGIRHFNTKEDFILWVKKIIEEDKQFLYNKEIPKEILIKNEILRGTMDGYWRVLDSYYNYYLPSGLSKVERKKILTKLHRLDDMKSNQLAIFALKVEREYNGNIAS